jgi:hypothetical protein
MASIERTTNASRLVALCICALAASGCSESGETPESIALPAAPAIVATPAIAASADTPLVSATSTQPPPASDAAASTESKANEAAVTPTPSEGDEAPPTVAEYQAPFPDRVDLFVPPKRQGGVRLDGESEDAVELLGFIRLDRQQVVLSINGQITPIAEGASQYGVEVISIHPPKVVLQRGRQRWQASLEN